MRKLEQIKTFFKRILSSFQKNETTKSIPLNENEYCEKHFHADLYCDNQNLFI